MVRRVLRVSRRRANTRRARQVALPVPSVRPGALCSRSSAVLSLSRRSPCLPRIGETIWAAGETCRDSLDDYFYGLGVRFARMAKLHERMLREYCWQARGGFRPRGFALSPRRQLRS